MSARKKKAVRSYSMDRVCFDLSAHLYRAFLAAGGAEHWQTKRYARQAQRNAGYVIAAGMQQEGSQK